MKRAYLALAVAGAVLPYVFFVRFFLSGDSSLRAFTEQLFATAPAAGFSTDLLITSLVFWLWSFHEARRLRMGRWWLYVVLNLAIGLSCALPAFLWAREGKVER